ncbi:MAG: hypothetical protein Q8K68_05275 [Nitrospirota bacterium]|nr:hypothetical protein [Nitrospirota bacterium]
MILHPAILALLVGSFMASAMLLYSSWFGLQIIRTWNLRSGSEVQLVLEKRTYLISTIMSYAFIFQLVSLFLFIYTADSLCSLFVGAMCAAGTLNVNAYGYPAFILKLVNFILAGLWLIVNHADNRAYDYPLIRKKYLLLLCITPFVLAETFLQMRYFLGLEADVITSCCGSLFSKEGRDSLSLLYAAPLVPMKLLYYAAMAGTGISGLLFYRRGKGAYIFSAFSLLTFMASAWFLVHVIVLYIYELPTHHCPFCIFKKEYAYVGYLFYMTLFAGVISGLGVGLLQPFARVNSMSSFVPGIQKRLSLIALVSYAGFFLLAVYSIITSTLKM